MRNFFCLLLVCLLAACVRDKPNPISCDQIAILRSQVGEVTSPEQFREWVSRTYQLPNEAIAIEGTTAEAARRGTVSFVGWHTGNFQYVAQLGSRVVLRFWVSGTDAPTDSLLACLGASAWYFVSASGAESGVQRDIKMFFPDQGIALDGWYYVPFGAQARLPANSDHLSWDLIIMKPGSVEQLVSDYYDYDPAQARDVLQQIKPWPGEWAQIEFPPYPPK